MITLTTQQIDAMEAGPELDTLVATALGLPCTRYDDSRQPGAQNVPIRYSTRIAAAWKVVEKLRGIYDVGLHSHGGSWQCDLCYGHGPGDRYTGSAPTAPLAICRAALHAVIARSRP